MEQLSNIVAIMQHNVVFTSIIVLLYGFIIGSFLNVVIYRLPVMMNLEYLNIIKDVTELSDDVITSKMNKDEKKYYDDLVSKSEMTLSKPRSTCGACNGAIPMWHNIPVLSYLILAGKCSKCKSSYSPRYMFVEIFIGALFYITYLQFGLTFEFLAISTLFSALTASALIDYDHKILPDSITFGGLFMGLGYNIMSDGRIVSATESIVGAVVGYLVIWGFVKGYQKIRNIDMAMGDGDLKLYAMCGAWIGLNDLMYLIILSSVIGLLQFISLWIIKKIKGVDANLSEFQLPFGPAIIMALSFYIYIKPIING
jgi:leader peptidase (prepilin peptidase)/N-methyltransferase